MNTERQGQVGRYTLTPAEMGHRVERACALEHGWVLVQCVPGGWRVLNVRPFWEQGPAFQALRDPAVFASAKTDDGLLTWPPDITIDSDVVYWDSVPASEYFAQAQAVQEGSS